MPEWRSGPQPVPDPIRNPTPEALEAARFIKPHLFERITDPDAGKIDQLIDGLIPKGDATLWVAAWKTAKTMLAYSLSLGAIQGKPIWGRFAVARPLRIMILQYEMPSHEDDRRYRKLSLGAGLEPALVQELAQSGQLIHISRPKFDLTDHRDLNAFLAYVSIMKPDLIIIDSVVAAFCSVDLNDNSTVRRVLSRVLGPLIDMGISVLLLHHFRKMLAMEHHPDKKSAVMGAAQFGAATSRTYAIERIDDDEDTGSSFTVKLNMLGGWTPSDGASTLIHVQDTDDGFGTIVQAIDATEEIELPDVNLAKIAAVEIQDIVLMRGRIPRKDLFALLEVEKKWSEKTVKRGLAYAIAKQWVVLENHPGSRHNEKDVVPYYRPADDGD